MTDPDDAGHAGDPLDARITEFARSELGPASAAVLRSPAALDGVRRRIASGQQLGDAVLGTLHGWLPTDRRVANEFAAHFLDDLMRTGSIPMAYHSRLRRFLDTGDLVLSVFGDMWGDLSGLHFESRDQFRNLFAQRVHWKAADKVRRLHSRRRREDRRVPQQPEELELHAHDRAAAPLGSTIQREERDRLILILLRLKERDRRLLTLHLKGESAETIARELQLPSTEAARKAISRAIGQARALANSGRGRAPGGASEAT